MGQYEPNDSRNVTLQQNDGSTAEPSRTGPGTEKVRQHQQEQQQGEPGQKNQAHGGQEQASYGNSRDEQGHKEADMAKTKKGQAEEDTLTSPEQAMADASRPVGSPDNK